MRTPFDAPSSKEPANRRRAPVQPVAPVKTAPRSPREPLLARLRAGAAGLVARVKGPALLMVRVVLALALAASTVALYRMVEQWVRTAPEFELTEIRVEGLERLDETEIRALADVHLGDNVFARSPDEIQAALSDHPWIADVDVTRRLPGTLHITVSEHHAALLLLLDAPYLVSDAGILIKRAEPGDPMDLPVITGVDRARFVSDLGFRTQLLATLVALRAEYDDTGLGRRAHLGELHLERGDEITLFVGDEAMEVRLGRGPYRGKLERLGRVLDELRREEARAAYVFLDNVRRPDRVTVRLR